nr:unnamed protein product [Callosobruchus analis]
MGKIRLCSKLTDTHISPNKVNKMKVKICTKVFSHSKNLEEFWQTAIFVVDSMKFFCPQKRKLVLVPTLRNLKFAIKGFTYLKRKLLQDKNFKFILTGASIRIPLKTFLAILGAMSLVINNCMPTYSPGSSCQKDTTVRNLDTLHITPSP